MHGQQCKARQQKRRKVRAWHDPGCAQIPRPSRPWAVVAAALLLLLGLSISCPGVLGVTPPEFNTLFSLAIRGNEPDISYFWNGVQVLSETKATLTDVASARLYVEIDNVTYSRSVMLHGGDSRFERQLVNETWVLNRTRPSTWAQCEGGPYTIGGTLHQVLHFVNSTSTAVATARHPSSLADPTLSLWVYHGCKWYDVSEAYPERIPGTYFPAAVQYEPLEMVVLFGGCVHRVFKVTTSLRDRCDRFNNNNTFTLFNARAVVLDWAGEPRPADMQGPVFKSVQLQPAAGDQAPTGRRVSAATIHQGMLWLFGGEGLDAEHFCDLWRVDITGWESATWQNIDAVPLRWEFVRTCNTSHHLAFNTIGNTIMTGLGNYLYMLGSANLPTTNGPMVVLAWDIVNERFWSVASEHVQRPAWPVEFSHFNVPRGAFSSIVTERATGMLFGDFSGLRTGKHNSVWEFTTFVNHDDPDVIFVPVPNINRPTPRVGHTFNRLSTQDLIVFGGTDGRISNEAWLFHLEVDNDGQWTYLPPMSGTPQPHPRMYHFSAIVGNGLVVFGGTDAQEKETFDDFWYLLIRNNQTVWQQLQPMGDSHAWAGMAGASYTCRQATTTLAAPPGHEREVRCVSFGGQQNGDPTNDLFAFQFFQPQDDYDAVPLVRITGGMLRSKQRPPLPTTTTAAADAGADSSRPQSTSADGSGEEDKEDKAEQYPPARVHGIVMRDSNQAQFVLLGGRMRLTDNARDHVLDDIWLFEFSPDVRTTADGRFIVDVTRMQQRKLLDPNAKDDVERGMIPTNTSISASNADNQQDAGSHSSSSSSSNDNNNGSTNRNGSDVFDVPPLGYYDVLCPIDDSACAENPNIFFQLACYLPTDVSDAKWLFYGGRHNTELSDAVWEFDFKLYRFTQLQVRTGSGINKQDEAARWGHTCFFHKGHMLTFGGVSNNNNYLGGIAAMRPYCNAGWHTTGVDFATSSCIPCRGDSFFQSGRCIPCPRDTVNEGLSLLSSTCDSCSRRERRRCQGSCQVQFERPTCVCSGLQFGQRCQYPVIPVILVPVLAAVGIGHLIFVLCRRHRRMAAANEVLETLLGNVHEELASLEKVFEIDMKDITLIKRIDKRSPGAMGDVYKAKYNGKTVAVKKLKAILIEDDGNEEANSSLREFQEETLFLRGIRHANIVFFYGAGVDSSGVPFLVTDYCARGSLSSIINNHDFELPLRRKLGFLLDAARGMAFLHGLHPPRVHGDLKSANLLVTANWTVQIADFGTSCLCDHLEDKGGSARASMRGRSGSIAVKTQGQWQAEIGALGSTPRWAAPEVLAQDVFLLASDVYSFGMVVFELEARSMPFPTVRFNNEVENLVSQGRRPAVPDDAHPFLAKLMQDCWQQTATLRPSFARVYEQLDAAVHGGSSDSGAAAGAGDAHANSGNDTDDSSSYRSVSSRRSTVTSVLSTRRAATYASGGRSGTSGSVSAGRGSTGRSATMLGRGLSRARRRMQEKMGYAVLSSGGDEAGEGNGGGGGGGNSDEEQRRREIGGAQHGNHQRATLEDVGVAGGVEADPGEHSTTVLVGDNSETLL